MFKTTFQQVARALGWKHSQRPAENSNAGQPPLRAEMFSADQMEQHGKALASAHVLGKFGPRNRLLGRLDDNQRVLIDACNLLLTAVKAKRPISPAGEWLLDNFYLIEEQILTAKKHLPKGYSRELPRLAQGPSRELPRVYDLALNAIAHGDGRVDAQSLARFVAAYQSVTPLTLGELWAIPIMLRLALIENLRRVSVALTEARIHVDQAQDWANRMMEMAERDPKNLILVIADMARSDPPMVGAFVAELVRRLHGHGPALALPLTWIERRLAESSLTIEQLVLKETQTQAADQVSISNSIGSLRFLGAIDWRDFVESMSFVEKVLREDQHGCYAANDFATRDRYRHVIDRLAKCSDLSETVIARVAIELADRNAAIAASSAHTAHVGYYLIDQGLAQLEAAVKARVSIIERVRRAAERSPLMVHLGTVLLLTAIIAGGVLAQVEVGGAEGWRWLLFGSLAVLAASQMASILANWLATLLVKPKLLPRMDYAKGLPPQLRTLVVVPTLLIDQAGVDTLIEALEVRFLGNQDAHIHFALLTDLADAPFETLAADGPLLRFARAGIERLNSKYPGDQCDRFFLLHRPRRWNPVEQIWMGYERKRGKLADLNAALRGDIGDRFALVVGRFAALTDVKYVITLDTDTQLPREAARQFVATMAHPLNRPRYDASRQRVCGGYGILQPRMAASLAAANRSRYAELFGAEPGIDPYTRSVSDVYQDLFGEGSFIGKGIYDVDAFELALRDRFPENRILSHDLLEGCYVRSGLLSDVHLFEDYPARYQADVSRQHRWIRGDWQIADWMLGFVPGPDQKRLRNPLSWLSRWKIFDNLRRSLVPVALLVLLLVGWFIVPDAATWTLAVLALVLLPGFLIGAVDLMRVPEEFPLRPHIAAVVRSLGNNLAATTFKIACLPYEAWFTLDAIVRTNLRIFFSRRGLLEWKVSSNPASIVADNANQAATKPREEHALIAAYRDMWVAPLLAIATALLLYSLQRDALMTAMPLLVLWSLAPAIVFWLGRPLRRREARLSDEQLRFLRKMARKTWGYFEHFFSAEDNWLVPDNFQSEPGPVVAHRTSPTNIGMALLANLSAYDFGFISAGSLLERTGLTFGSLAKLERHQGHFYNWYDTSTLQPLAPRYVSSVDSGNLAGHLLTLRAGLLALPDQKILAPRLLDGLLDTFGLFADAAHGKTTPAILHLRALINANCIVAPSTLPSAMHCLDAIASAAAKLGAELDIDPDSEARLWASAFVQQAQAALEELRYLVPWFALFAPASPTGAPAAAKRS